MSSYSRRGFLAGLAAATGAAAATLPLAKVLRPAKAGAETSHSLSRRRPKRLATLIDLAKCDGCPGESIPACVAACRTANADRFPEPDPEHLKDYWPQRHHEDWSDRRHLTNRLTPYNWIFVQQLNVEHKGREHEVHIPRRCMHCDNPPCVKLCPFGVLKQEREGLTWVDSSLCMGGAKCRDVCPWSVPQRQAGVGPYTYLDPLPVGGGLMYKCDLCRDRVAEGLLPACAEGCTKGAIRIGDRDALDAEAEKLAQEYGGELWRDHLYGRSENGGTSTFYVSKVPFESIDTAIVRQVDRQRAQLQETDPRAASRLTAMRMDQAPNMLDRHRGLAFASVLAPIAGAAAAFATTVSKVESKKRSPKREEPTND